MGVCKGSVEGRQVVVLAVTEKYIRPLGPLGRKDERGQWEDRINAYVRSILYNRYHGLVWS